MHALSTLVLVSVVAQPADLPPWVKEHARTVTFYYQKPNPELGPKLLREFIAKENLEHPWYRGKEHVVNLNAAAFGDMVAGNPKLVREYEAMFADTSTAGRRVIIRALENCGAKETVKAIDGWLGDKKYADVQGDLEALKKHLEAPKRQHARDRAAKEPKDLDFLWVNFFITGEYAPISQLLDVFDQPDRPENAVMKRVAKWSLGSNMEQHPKLTEMVKQHAKERPERSRKVVEDLIDPKP